MISYLVETFGRKPQEEFEEDRDSYVKKANYGEEYEESVASADGVSDTLDGELSTEDRKLIEAEIRQLKQHS